MSRHNTVEHVGLHRAGLKFVRLQQRTELANVHTLAIQALAHLLRQHTQPPADDDKLTLLFLWSKHKLRLQYQRPTTYPFCTAFVMGRHRHARRRVSRLHLLRRKARVLIKRTASFMWARGIPICLKQQILRAVSSSGGVSVQLNASRFVSWSSRANNHV